jgi:hypothetical protein
MAKRLPARRTPAVAKPTARQAALESGQVGRRRFCGQPATPAMVGRSGLGAPEFFLRGDCGL